MLKISQAQLDARIATESGFTQWFVDQFMPEELPEFHAEFTRDKLLATARRARRTAIDLGFDDPPSQAHFVALMWRLGANFFQFPGFQEIARDTATAGPVRVDRFYTQVTPDQAADAILNSDDTLLFISPLDDDEDVT